MSVLLSFEFLTFTLNCKDNNVVSDVALYFSCHQTFNNISNLLIPTLH